MYKDYINSFLDETRQIVEKLGREDINKMIGILKDVRDKKGRLFIIGVGGGAGTITGGGGEAGSSTVNPSLSSPTRHASISSTAIRCPPAPRTARSTRASDGAV